MITMLREYCSGARQNIFVLVSPSGTLVTWPGLLCRAAASLRFIGHSLSIAELDVFERANSIAPVGNRLRMPDKRDRHGAHDQEAEDKSEPTCVS